MDAKRFIVALSLSTVFTVYSFFVFMAWEREASAFLAGMPAGPNDSTLIFFIFGIIMIWRSKKLWQQLFFFCNRSQG